MLEIPNPYKIIGKFYVLYPLGQLSYALIEFLLSNLFLKKHLCLGCVLVF